MDVTAQAKASSKREGGLSGGVAGGYGKLVREVGKGCQDISLMKDLPSSRKKRKQCDNNDKYLLNTY